MGYLKKKEEEKNFLFFICLTNIYCKKTPLRVNMKKSFLLFILLTTCLCLCVILFPPDRSLPTLSDTQNQDTILSFPAPTIIIDAGHGGKDPGKVGTTGTLEKNINLKIALYLKEILESQDITVIMTRVKDEELSTNTTNRKISDMEERVALIEKSNADVVISIHQNSYTDPGIYGAQCFYYTDSEEGKILASALQKHIIHSTNQTKIREIKGNDDYYLLKYSSLPTVIVECGFLSNPQEEKLLVTDEYQRKMAWAIHLGTLEYLNSFK